MRIFPCKQAQEQSECPVIKAEIKSEEQEHEKCNRRRQATILMHGVEYPVASSDIPDDPARISEKKALPGRRRNQLLRFVELDGLGCTGAQDGDDKRGESDPRKNIQAGKREAQNLQGSGKKHQQPGVPANLPHAGSIAKTLMADC